MPLFLVIVPSAATVWPPGDLIVLHRFAVESVSKSRKESQSSIPSSKSASAFASVKNFSWFKLSLPSPQTSQSHHNLWFDLTCVFFSFFSKNCCFKANHMLHLECLLMVMYWHLLYTSSRKRYSSYSLTGKQNNNQRIVDWFWDKKYYVSKKSKVCKVWLWLKLINNKLPCLLLGAK